VPAVYFYIGSILEPMQNVVPANMRAMACAILLYIVNLANLVCAPQIIGWLSDWFAGYFGAGQRVAALGFLLLAPRGFWAARHLWTSAKTIRAEAAHAAGEML
jgi:hypothetical protein